MPLPNLYQPSLFDPPVEKPKAIVFDMVAGKKLGEVGLSLALETAEKKEKGWQKRTWQLFLWWLRYKKRGHEFMIEEFRGDMYAKDLIEKPPSERAYGFLSKWAVKGSWIEFAGNKKVSNTKAHGAFANVWRKK